MNQINLISSNNQKLISSVSHYEKIALLNMPKIGLNNPPMAPALLQSIAKQMGAETSFIDINLLFHNQFEKNGVIINDWCELDLKLSEDNINLVKDFTEKLDLTDIWEADIVAISVFSYHSFNYTSWFLNQYRSKIKGKIVLGGAGVTRDNYGKNLYDNKLIDYYVLGEGELPWRAILCDDLPYPGVNQPSETLQGFEFVPIPDYTNYTLDQYLNSKVYGVTIGVEGSRGCVRNCTFCDIREFWDKYKFKDGKKLAEELLTLREKYAVNHFFFNDSLINGSDKAFRDFIKHLAEYNNSNENKISWSAYFIVKPAITYKEEDWKNLKDSGVKSLFIGIESGSESVRNHMKKKFSDSDIDHLMRKLQYYGIRCTWLLIIGYPTETRKDFQDTLDMLAKYQPMALDNTIDTVALGLTMGITPGSPLSTMTEELNIRAAVADHSQGVYWENENSDFKERVLRRIQAEKHIRALGYNSWVGDNDVISYFEQKLQDIENGKMSDSDVADHHG